MQPTYLKDATLTLLYGTMHVFTERCVFYIQRCMFYMDNCVFYTVDACLICNVACLDRERYFRCGSSRFSGQFSLSREISNFLKHQSLSWKLHTKREIIQTFPKTCHIFPSQILSRARHSSGQICFRSGSEKIQPARINQDWGLDEVVSGIGSEEEYFSFCTGFLGRITGQGFPG